MKDQKSPSKHNRQQGDMGRQGQWQQSQQSQQPSHDDRKHKSNARGQKSDHRSQQR